MMRYAILLLCVVGAWSEDLSAFREGRQIFNRQTNYHPRGAPRYGVCGAGDTVGACLSSANCARERGMLAGTCGYSEGACCVVDKSCGEYSKSHALYFRNPTFPRNSSDAALCPLTLMAGKGVCAVRLVFEVFELSSYTEGVCIGDHLTVLGTKQGATTPVCGNMTGWTSTFDVEERSEVQLVMVLQGAYNSSFSIRVTQIACEDVHVFHSPTYSGIRNPDAPYYKPTTKKPNFVLIKPITTPKPAKPEEEPTTTTSSPTEEVTEEATTTEANTEGPTTLLPGTIPTPRSNDVLIRAPDAEEGLLEYVETTPLISAFKRAFELKVDDRCWQYEPDIPGGFRVIGGEYTGINEYPWQVALVYKNKFFCGGSLISDRHVLTAAHCVFGSFKSGINDLRVSVGDHDLSTKNETEHIVARVKHVHWHLHYNPHTTAHDIAMFELEEPLVFRYGVSAVRLPSDLEELYDTANATVTGWGRYNVKTKATNPVMKEFTGPLAPIDKCVTAWNKFPGISARNPNHICLDVTHGTPCHGDSGGPLVVCSGNQCTQVGVVSFGFPMCTNVGLPAVFTRVSHYKGWIDINLTPLEFVGLEEESEESEETEENSDEAYRKYWRMRSQ